LDVGWWQSDSIANRMLAGLFLKKPLDGSLKNIFFSCFLCSVIKDIAFLKVLGKTILAQFVFITILCYKNRQLLKLCFVLYRKLSHRAFKFK
jgi:hypothetical protein